MRYIPRGMDGVLYRASEMLKMVEMLVIQYGWQLAALMIIGALLMKMVGYEGNLALNTIAK